MTATFFNPIISPDGPDPFLWRHENQFYLSVTRGGSITVRRAATLGELKDEPEIEVWRGDAPRRSMHIWAPEFFRFEEKWLCYYTASDRRIKNHRCYVLENQSDSPLGPYAFKAQLQTDEQNAYYAIDATVIENSRGQKFCFWAGFPDHRLFASAMENPWTLCGPRHFIEAEGFGCEEVREGPVCLRRNGKIFLIYSICDTAKPDYKLGMLFANEDADLANPQSWTQFARPVFTRCDKNKVYGPGHSSFFQDARGADWIAYHAKSTRRYTQSGRSARVQRFGWDADGFPDFGAPLSLETPIEDARA